MTMAWLTGAGGCIVYDDDDKKLAALIALCCIVGSLALILVAMIVTPARAAAILDLDGNRIIVMTAEEFKQFVDSKDAEIAKLKAKPCT